MKAEVVIGANYGDEGKGLITDYLAAQDNSNTLVVRFNGGAQAGHTVQRPNGLRHVFSHFSSGTFAGAETYLSEFFIANPALFVSEKEKLEVKHFTPKVTIHPDAIITTPYDMFINQAFENFRGKNRHGSCGVGINETIERNFHSEFRLTVNCLFNQKKLKEKLLTIRDKWLPLRWNQLIPEKISQQEIDLIFSTDIYDYFLENIQRFLSSVNVGDHTYLKKYQKIIFEGAQGLLLDQGHQNFPFVTRSNTGIQNVSTLASLKSIKHLDIYYVTRCYLTRHGAGPLPNELDTFPCPYFKDETNIPHAFQGTLRFAPLNIEKMNAEICADLTKLSKQISKKITLAVTCLDQFEDIISVVSNEKNIVELRRKEFLDSLFDQTKFDRYLFSCGPGREDCRTKEEIY